MIRKNIKNIEKQADDPVCFFICKWGGSNRVNKTQKNNQKSQKKWLKVLTVLVERCII